MPLLPPRASIKAWGFGGDEKQFNMKDIFVSCSAGASLAAFCYGAVLVGLRRSAGGRIATAACPGAVKYDQPKIATSVV